MTRGQTPALSDVDYALPGTLARQLRGLLNNLETRPLRALEDAEG